MRRTSVGSRCRYMLFLGFRFERWNGGTVERWNGGTVERWNGGTVERWNGGTRQPEAVSFHRFTVQAFHRFIRAVKEDARLALFCEPSRAFEARQCRRSDVFVSLPHTSPRVSPSSLSPRRASRGQSALARRTSRRSSATRSSGSWSP